MPIPTELLQLVVSGGMGIVVAWWVWHATTNTIPGLQQKHSELIAQARSDFSSALSNQRMDFIQAMAQQRTDFIGELKQQRDEFREQVKQYRADLHSVRDMMNEHLLQRVEVDRKIADHLEESAS